MAGITKKEKLQIIGINLILFAALFGLVTFNKSVLRANFTGTLINCLPNFLAALLISLCFVNAVRVRKPARSTLLVYAGSLTVFLILASEEIWPMWGASTHYDMFDIIASAAGSILAVLIYHLILLRRKRAAAV